MDKVDERTAVRTQVIGAEWEILEEALDPDEEYPGGLPEGSDFWKPNTVWLSTGSVAQALGLVQELRNSICVHIWWRGGVRDFGTGQGPIGSCGSY